MRAQEWDEVVTKAYKLVFRNTNSTNGEHDVQLARLTSRALLVGLDADWLAECLRREDIEAVSTAVNRRLH